MNKTLLVVFVVVLALGALFMMKDKDKAMDTTPAPTSQEAPVAEEETEVEETEEDEVAPVVEDTTPAPAAPVVPVEPVTTVADVNETLSDLDALTEPAYDDSSLDSEVDGGFDDMNDAYAF